MEATVVIPAHANGETLRIAVESVQNQTLGDIEVFIIGDGVPEAHKPWIQQMVGADSRLHFLDHPKHKRRGEEYRHEALASAKGKIVCYLCDRDFWFPEHLERMREMLKVADYGHSLPLHVLPDRSVKVFAVDVRGAVYKDLIINTLGNRIPLSCFAHTLAAYRRLPEGWATTPDGIPTDQYMFRKFLAMEDMTGVSGVLPTAVTFPSRQRPGWNMQQRLAELKFIREALSTPGGRAQFEIHALIDALQAQREDTIRIGEHLMQLTHQPRQSGYSG